MKRFKKMILIVSILFFAFFLLSSCKQLPKKSVADNKYYWINVECDILYEESGIKIFGKYMFIIEAPNEKAFWSVVKKVKGNCTEDTPISKIEMNIERKFQAYDPIEFKGTPIEIIYYGKYRYLKIKIIENVFVFIEINVSGDCLFLKPI